MRPRMTAADLAAAWDECPTPAMRRVLWEVLLLQGTIKRAHNLRMALGNGCPPGVNPIIWECFRDQIDAEPSLHDEMTPRQRKRSEAYVARAKAQDSDS
jgi:hypothetical protein